MEKYHEVIERILQLLETMEEGYMYIKDQLEKLCYEESFIVLNDAMGAVNSIENALYPIKAELPENSLDAFIAAIKHNMNNAINSYEQGKEVYLTEQIEKEVLPSFLAWKKELERVLRPYVIS